MSDMGMGEPLGGAEIGGAVGGGNVADAPPIETNAPQADNSASYNEPPREPPARQGPAARRDGRGQFSKPTQPPQSWPQPIRETHWPNLHPDLQSYLSQRDGETHKAITGYGDRLKSYEPVDRVFNEYRSSYEKHGMDGPTAVSFLFKAQQMLEQNAPAALTHIAASYGIDLNPFFSGQHTQASEANATLRDNLMQSQTRIEAMAKELAGVKKEYADYKTQVELKAKAADAARAAKLNVRSGYVTRENPKNMNDTIEETAAAIYGR